MSAIKDGRVPVMLDKQRYLLYSLNAMDDLIDKYDTYDNFIKQLKDKKQTYKTLMWVVAKMINEAEAFNPEHVPLTERQVGSLLHIGNQAEVAKAVNAALTVGISGKTDTSSDDDTEDIPEIKETEEKNAPELNTTL